MYSSVIVVFPLLFLGLPDLKSYYSTKLSNVWGKSTFQIRQNYPAPVGLLPEPDFCRIWKMCRIPAGAEIRYSPSWNSSKMISFG